MVVRGKTVFKISRNSEVYDYSGPVPLECLLGRGSWVCADDSGRAKVLELDSPRVRISRTHSLEPIH